MLAFHPRISTAEGKEKRNGKKLLAASRSRSGAWTPFADFNEKHQFTARKRRLRFGKRRIAKEKRVLFSGCPFCLGRLMMMTTPVYF
jgi:hypothetical protein